MTQWSVQLLGIPSARRGNDIAHLRSKATWAVLASLLLDGRLKAAGWNSPPQRLARTALADRFWGNMENPRLHLRQALNSLQRAFEEDEHNPALRAERDTIQARPEFFVTDFETMCRLADTAQRAETPEERLALLIEAEGQIGGAFLEECPDFTEEGTAWYVTVGAQIEAKIAAVLLALIAAYQEEGNLNAAFDIALRLLTLCPQAQEGKRLAWELTLQTGQQHAFHSLEATQEYHTALPRVAERERRGHSLTAQDARLFEALLTEQIEQLSETESTALNSLAVFPAPFSPALAKAVCHVPRSLLKSLWKRGMLEQEATRYALLRPTRSYLWRQLSSSEKRTLKGRFQKVCVEWVKEKSEGWAHRLELFASIEEANSHIEAVLKEVMSAPITKDTLDFLHRVHSSGFPPLLVPHFPLLKSVAETETTEPFVRYGAARFLGEIRLHEQKFHEATHWFDLCLSVVNESETYERHSILSYKAQCAHYSGGSPLAAQYLREILAQKAAGRGIYIRAGTHRFLCEVLHQLQEYDEALPHAETALALYRELNAGDATLADALFWQGNSLCRLQRTAEAEGCLNHALTLWQEVGDKTGVGHCLRTLATLLLEQGQTAQARANLDYAISLHQQTGSEGCRIAAVEVLAEVCLRQGYTDAARQHLKECLTYYQQQGRGEKTVPLCELLDTLSPA